MCQNLINRCICNFVLFDIYNLESMHPPRVPGTLLNNFVVKNKQNKKWINPMQRRLGNQSCHETSGLHDIYKEGVGHLVAVYCNKMWVVVMPEEGEWSKGGWWWQERKESGVKGDDGDKRATEDRASDGQNVAKEMGKSMIQREAFWTSGFRLLVLH